LGHGWRALTRFGRGEATRPGAYGSGEVHPDDSRDWRGTPATREKLIAGWVQTKSAMQRR
jgi:hypothetical protein